MTFSPTFLRFVAAFGIVASLVSCQRIVESFGPGEIYRKDFMQEYVLGKAVVDGESIYVVFPLLVAKYFDPMPAIPMSHPTPHTPVAAMLCVPLGLFSYPIAAVVWLIVELCGLAAAVELLIRWWGERVAWWKKGILFLICLGLGPVVRELFCGQYNFVLLFFLLISWLTLRRGFDIYGGGCLGFAVALKWTAWPIILYLVFRGRWRAVVSAGAVSLGLYGIAGLVVGSQNIADFYSFVGPEVTRQYRQHESNYSLWTIGPRFFATEPAEIACEFTTFPLLPSAFLDRVTTVTLPALAFLLTMIVAWRCKQFDSAFGILLCASLPINPVAWDHYLVLTAIPIVVVFRRLKDVGFPKVLTGSALAALGISALPNVGYIRLMAQLFTIGYEDNVPVVPFVAGLIAYLPLVPITIWIVLLSITDARINAPPSR